MSSEKFKMSDSIEELVRAYEEHINRQGYPRSIGLFPIPEYPELEPRRGMWSAALDAILTTLRYLAPATLLTLFWGQQSFLFKLLKHIDSAFRAIVFSSEEQKQSVLIWLAEAGPVRVEHLETVWRHGWIVCAVLDAALPGACAGHPPTRLSLKHAQAIADHYLGVEPVFSRQELDSNDSLSKHQEWKLATFLDRIRQSLAKLTPPVSKPPSQRTSPETTQFTLDYVARGSGLTAAQINNKSHFKIYPTSQQSLDPGEITILIRGPKDTYGMTVLPPILGKAQLIRQKLLDLNSKPNYTENILPITQGAIYLRSYGKIDMNKTYHIPKTHYDIEIEAEPRGDHTKISYLVNIEGKYDISITSRGQSIVGSPFTVTGSRNILSILEKESFSLEDGEEIDIVDIKTDRKVVLRIVDFVTEKMLLKENGSLEKISDDEAKVLMATDSNDEFDYNTEETMTKIITEHTLSQKKKKNFCGVVTKVILINRVIDVFNDLMKEVYTAKEKKEKTTPYHSNQQHIPDIVNSTLSDTKINSFILSEKRNKYIIPENINVSLKTEKSCANEFIEENVPSQSTLIPKSNTINNYEILEQERDLFNIYENNDEDEIMTISSSPSNPFLIDTYTQNYKTEKDLGTYVATEYERNNFQNEEFPESPIKIMIEENITSSPNHNNNPFIDTDTVFLERPKTPVLKIISGDLKNRNDSVYVDPRMEQLNEQMLGNEFINPFFIHQHHQSQQLVESLPITDFIIGAPVSLPPIIRTSTPEPILNSLIITKEDFKETKDTSNDALNNTTNGETKSEFSTPLHTSLKPKNMSEGTNKKVENYCTTSSTFHSLDSNLSENIEIFDMSDISELEPYQNETINSNVNKYPNKDIWDSAYVSIDENSSSPDTNNNDNTQACESINKQKFPQREELSNMGPAERELWQTCNELNEGLNRSEDVKNLKWEPRKSNFTPIIEESDRSISTGMKDVTVIEITQSKSKDSDPVTVAFAELNDMYEDYFPKPESDWNINPSEEENLTTLKVKNVVNTENFVDSASEMTDVKRHTNDFEGKISEVQANVTESVSVSQPLPYQIQDPTEARNQICNEIQFGDRNKTNIVLERKKYWDDRIRQIEAKSQETTTFQKKRRLSSKHLRYNDSLTKRRGKQIVKNFLNTNDCSKKTTTNNEDNTFDQIHKHSFLTEIPSDDAKPDVKLVDKWKKYWDDKLESEHNPDTTITEIILSKDKTRTNFEQNINKNNEFELTENKQAEINLPTTSAPVKQELPEEVFRAFETSPKRFFGTSRKQILNKIDIFLGKPSIEDNISHDDVPNASRESGLVSSRISLFHSISQTEELPRVHRKCKSLHNISEPNDNNKVKSLIEKNICSSNMEDKIETQSKTNSISVDSDDDTKTILKEKRNRISLKTFNKSFDESIYQKPTQLLSDNHSLEQSSSLQKENNYVKNTIKDFNKKDQRIPKYKNVVFRRKSFSKSEMDIFNKATTEPEDDLEKYKSCDELPKINVKNFISLYESVSKTSVNSKSTSKLKQMSSESYRPWQTNNPRLDAGNKSDSPMFTKVEDQSTTTSPSLSSKAHGINKSFESISSTLTDMKIDNESVDVEINDSQESTFLSLSDIELEIIENNTDQSSKSPTPEKEILQTDYKSRFKMAKQYFQSLEELVEPKKPRKMNECELLLESKSINTIESAAKRPQKRVKKNIKSHSMPSSEISKIWHQLHDNTETEAGATKLVKISEKFNVEDLFTDVMEGRLSRQGSLRGIPHKKAVLETFKSMENLNDKKYSPYEIAVSQLNEFAKENKIKNAQTFLTEYPYLPTTDPSKYHSRIDTNASGLISFKEIINIKPRRNSVPDLRLNPIFTDNL